MATDKATIDTVADILQHSLALSGNGCAYNDRGNGCAGPGFITVEPSDVNDGSVYDMPVREVDFDDDRHAWVLACVAHDAHKLGMPTRVWVGPRDATQSNPHQMIYSI